MTPMTPEEEKEIREDDASYITVEGLASDRRLLLAEIDRLREVVERSLRLCAECGKGFLETDWALERQELEEDNAKLREELSRQRLFPHD